MAAASMAAWSSSIAEDDGTDPKRGAEVVEKFATQHGCDVGFGTLSSATW
jgi:ABC-type branched-subunit amino acid transport system substrate-binding protein